MGLSSFHTSTIVQVVFAAAGAGAFASFAHLGSPAMKGKEPTRRNLQSVIVFIAGAGLSLTLGLPLARYAMGSQPGAFAHVAAAGFSAVLAFVFGAITHQIAMKALG